MHDEEGNEVRPENEYPNDGQEKDMTEEESPLGLSDDHQQALILQQRPLELLSGIICIRI